MIKGKSKKGFTIVELVIVITVIAILSAVLIPTFTGIVRKARASADEQAVRNMNVALATASIYGEIETIDDVYEVLSQAGYGEASYTPNSDNAKFVWVKDRNVIACVDESSQKITYPQELKGVQATSGNCEDLKREIDPNRLNYSDRPEAQAPNYNGRYDYPDAYYNSELKQIDIFTFYPSDNGEDNPVYNAQREKYGNWLADFAIIINDDFTEEGTAGICGSHKFYNGWVEMTIPEEGLQKGQTFLLLRDIIYGESSAPVYGIEYSWLIDLCYENGTVDGFHCGAFNFSEANYGKSITVELRLYEPDDQNGITGRYVVCNQVLYKFESPNK